MASYDREKDPEGLIRYAQSLEHKIERLQGALQKVHGYAEAYMEGAGEPEFSQFTTIAGIALIAINTNK